MVDKTFIRCLRRLSCVYVADVGATDPGCVGTAYLAGEKMNRSVTLIIGLSLLVVCIAALGLFVSVAGVEGWGFSNPQARARADAIELQAQVDAELARIKQESAKTNNEIASASASAAILRNAIIYSGTGLAVAVLAIMGAFSLGHWIDKRATSIHADANGIFPVIVKRSWNGVTIVHDPNRAIGPTTIYTAPSFPSPLARLLGAPQPDVTGQIAEPQDLVQIAAGALGVQMEAARNQKPLVSLPQGWGARIVHLHNDDRRSVDIDNQAAPQLPGSFPVRMLEAGSDEAQRMRLIAEGGE